MLQIKMDRMNELYLRISRSWPRKQFKWYNVCKNDLYKSLWKNVFKIFMKE